MKFTKISAVVAALFVASTAYADVATVTPRRAAGGMAQEFKNTVYEASSSPRTLVKATALTRDQTKIVSEAERVFNDNSKSVLSIMLVDRGQIIYEAYKEPASKDTVQFSWSMSKSLVAYTIGGMVCDGKIASINDPAKKYAPELEGTVFGDAQIKHLLTMSSGAVDSTFAGNAYKTATSDQWMDQRSGATTTLEVIRQYGKKDIEPGQEFRYLANDTQSLALIINNRGGFADNFNKYVWEPTKSNSRGYWLMGKDLMPIGAAGFSATTGDWARLAMFTIDAKKNGSQCIKDFMQTATSQQIANKKKRIGAAFNGYGYQTWANPNFGNGKSYWWVGYGGQRVGVDSDKERIIVVTSHREDYMPDVYKLFAKFQQY